MKSQNGANDLLREALLRHYLAALLGPRPGHPQFDWIHMERSPKLGAFVGTCSRLFLFHHSGKTQVRVV